ncbi:hypothetical protein [Streptomyces longispororuber]|uniref:hypothetical protein n=1 Tax=Streptomyces longispororuber TaxID=68230 RepID=UPI002108F1B4|nr:hypothetical protein [Streptomyces longispororuber]MCQ4205532.1 hypothetical protein [Streptomyces longispororuber]
MPTQRQRATVDAPLQPTSTQPGEHAAETDSSPELPAMKAPDHYYLAYTHYLDRHGREPKGATAYTELAQHLANQGIFGPTGRPVSASTLRRYALEQRIYHRWTHAYDTHGKPPTSEQLLQRLADDRVKAGNRPLTVHDLQRAEHLATGFHRRHTTLHHHNHPPQQPPRPTHTPPEDTATTPEPAGERQHHTTDDHPPLPTER